MADFNPPTPRGVGLHPGISPRCGNCISIHPPRVGWDGRRRKCQPSVIDFNPPTPRGVGQSGSTPSSTTWPFQSTHPAWGGTTDGLTRLSISSISIHPPRVGWDSAPLWFSASKEPFQSTHPAWGGTKSAGGCPHPPGFQSTHPAWGGTGGGSTSAALIDISIHPPRVGWDRFVTQQNQFLLSKFQSTHPAWGGTWE